MPFLSLPPVCLSSAGTFDFEEWHHFVFTASAAGASIYVDKQKLPRSALAILGGDISATFGGFTVTQDLYVGSREDLHPGRFFTGSLAFLEVFGEALNGRQVACIYEGFWAQLVENSCYWKQPDISAGDEGKVRQRSSLFKAVITAFPCVSLPFFAVPLLSQRTVAIR
eukprot:SAG22_NODE_1030_length_5937_cov_2.536485_2_plen_168_part_00